MRFTDRGLKALKPPPRLKQVDYFDENLPGFGLRVSYNGRKSWIVMYRCNGIKGRLTVGRFDVVPLVEAREQARDAMKAALRGDDPAVKKHRDREAPTFKQLADRYVEEYAKPKKRTWQKDRRLLDNNLIPALGRKKAHLITRADLRAELNKVKSRPAPVEANRTFEVVRRLFNWAIEEEILTENPVFKLPKPAEETPRERTLAADELQTLWRALDDASPIVRGVFRLMLLSAQRRNEVSRMRSRSARALVEYPGRADEDQEALSRPAHPSDARHHRGDRNAFARSRLGVSSRGGRAAGSRDERDAPFPEADQGCQDRPFHASRPAAHSYEPHDSDGDLPIRCREGPAPHVARLENQHEPV
jgi:hypothetical protein